MKDRREEQERRHARALAWGIGLSVAFHVALFLVFYARPLAVSPFAAAGERMGDFVAASGGGLEAIQLSTPQRIPVVPEPLPTPTVEVADDPFPEPELETEEVPAIALDELLTAPGSEGPDRGPGLAADGLGDGGTEAEGRFRVVPPRPRGMILPPSDRPDRVRGREVDVWVYVTPTGEVAPDSTRLDPPTGDRSFDRRLREYASDWVFDAALKDGQPVGEWFRYTIIM